jgi:hypothetical protein
MVMGQFNAKLTKGELKLPGTQVHRDDAEDYKQDLASPAKSWFQLSGHSITV